MQIRIGLPLRSAWFEWPWGCSRDLDAMQMSRWCANSMRHQPSACAMLRRSAACVRPRRRGERDANAEEATGEKQLLRLERPLCKALYVGPTYNALSKARPSMTNQENEEVIRCRTCYIALTGGSPTPPHCPLVVFHLS